MSRPHLPLLGPTPASTCSDKRRWTRRRLGAALQLCLMAWLASGCNEYPVHSLLDSFEVRVTRALAQDQAVKIDFVWMIDHSPSMCQEQRQLAQGFNKFIETLQNYGKTKPTDPSFIDAQMAVVTVQQLPDSSEITKVGQFVHKAATELPLSCIERTKQPCLKDADCTKPQNFKLSNIDADSSLCPANGQVLASPLPGAPTLQPPPTSQDPNPAPVSRYYCKQANAAPTPDQPGSLFNNNDNCSINTICQHRCFSDADCYAVFEPDVPDGQHRVKCNKAGAPAPAGCMFPPESDGCPSPDKLPSVLKQSVAADVVGVDGKARKGTQLDWFRCMATVGANQSPEASFEGGLRSVWTALDPNGINCPKDAKGQPTKDCQYKQLVRDDAYLVIVMVSDDDDCSYAFELDPFIGDATSQQAKEAIKTLFPKETANGCQVLGDRSAGNSDLNAGYCEYLQFKDKLAGKAPRTCPMDCVTLPKGSAEALKCEADASAEVAKIVAENQFHPNIIKERALQNYKFATVTDFVNRFRSLKSDPARVIFAAVTGDSVAQDQGQKLRDRASVYRSLLRNQATLQQPYICQGSRGESNFGSRYIRVAEAFGDNGIVANICEGADFSKALDGIANTILSRVVKICLPHPPGRGKNGEPLLKVTRKRGNGATETMQFVSDPTKPEAGKDTAFYIKATADCLQVTPELAAQQGQSCGSTRDCPTGLACVDKLCKVYSEAIYFPITPKQGDEIQVNYAADIGL
jgi:hypothetical protein